MEKQGSRRSKLRRWLSAGLSLALMTGLLAACSGNSESGDGGTRVLRIGVLYGGADNEPYFRQQYTDMFEINNPNIEFEIVGAINYEDQRFAMPGPGSEPQEQPDPFEKMKELMTGANPVDLVVIDYNMLRRFTQDNLLQPLDPLIEQDKFDLSDYVPTVIDGIKSAGDNQIYALTPTFTSSALFYNKKLFADNNVEPPTDLMEWNDVLNKARQVVSGEGVDRTFGFAFNRWSQDGYSSLQNYTSSLGLKLWDDKGEKMLVNSDAWVNATELVVSLFNEKIIPDQEYMNLYYEKMYESGGNDPFYGDLFAQGKIAMMIDGYYYINELRRFSDNAAKLDGYDMIDWDVVTLPIDPSNPGVGGNIGLSQLMGINSKAQNATDAWEFIKFSNSREWAKLKSRSLYEMVARKEFLQPIGGMNYNIEAFTKLKPLPPSSVDDSKIYRDNPNIWEAQNLGYQIMQEVLSGDKDVREALAEWETRGDAILGGQSEYNFEEGPGVMPMPRFEEFEEFEEAPVDDVAVEEGTATSAE